VGLVGVDGRQKKHLWVNFLCGAVLGGF
jgi:hypothetical protein